MAKRSNVRRIAETKRATTKSKDKEKKKKKDEGPPEGAILTLQELMKQVNELITSRTVVGNIHVDDSDAPKRTFPTLKAECYVGRGTLIKFVFSDLRRCSASHEVTRVTKEQSELAVQAAKVLLKPFHGKIVEPITFENSVHVRITQYGGSCAAPVIAIVKARTSDTNRPNRSFQPPIKQRGGLSEKVIKQDLELEEDEPEPELVLFEIAQAKKAKLKKKGSKKQKASDAKEVQTTPPADDQ